MTALEADVVLWLRSLWRDVPEHTGPVPVSRETLAALRAERGLGPDAPVSVEVPRAKGVLSVPLVERRP